VGTKEKMSSIGQPVLELSVADVERAEQHYRDALGFEIGWLYRLGAAKEVHRPVRMTSGYWRMPTVWAEAQRGLKSVPVGAHLHRECSTQRSMIQVPTP